MHAKSLNRVQLFTTLWTVAHQASLSMAFPPPCHTLLREIVSTQGTNLGLLLCRRTAIWATRQAPGRHHSHRSFCLHSCPATSSFLYSRPSALLIYGIRPPPAWNHPGDSLTHKWNANSTQWDRGFHWLQPLITLLTSASISALSTGLLGVPDSQACYCLIFAPVSSLCAALSPGLNVALLSGET